MTLGEGQRSSFADFVQQKAEADIAQARRSAEVYVGQQQVEYDANLEFVNGLEVLEDLRNGAHQYRDKTKRRAWLDISARPDIKEDPDDPVYPQVVGSPDLTVTYSWEPIGTKGVQYSVRLVARKEMLIVESSKRTPTEFPKESVNRDQVVVALQAGYETPLVNGQIYS